MFITGVTGSGKSELAKRLTLGAPGRRLIVDPNDSTLTEIPGAVTFHDVRRATNPAGENWRDAAYARYVPRDPLDRDEYDDLYRWIHVNGPRWIWCDEAGFVMPAQGTPRGVNLVLTQGRKREIGHLAAHTRPREISSNLIAQSRHVFVFLTPLRKDREHLAGSMGCDFDTFEAAHGQLDRFGFLYWNLEARALTVCGALKL